jgi:hypothetical protein
MYVDGIARTYDPSITRLPDFRSINITYSFILSGSIGVSGNMIVR